MSPSPTVVGQEAGGRHLRFASKRLWVSIWVGFAVVMAVGVANYLLIFMIPVVPLWLWCIAGGGLVLAAALAAVFVDVASVRRASGRRPFDVVAQVAATVLVGVWLWLLGRMVAGDCVTEECEPAALWASLFVLIPIVPLTGLTLIGFLVRRGHRALGSVSRALAKE